MKVAICVSGSIRYPNKGLKSISKIIPNDTKIFIHTWKNVKSGKFLKTIHRLQAKEGIKEMIDTNFDLLQYSYEKIKVDKQGSVRRARIFYLRERRGKSARIREKKQYSKK